jgi:hypothetical protein
MNEHVTGDLPEKSMMKNDLFRMDSEEVGDEDEHGGAMSLIFSQQHCAEKKSGVNGVRDRHPPHMVIVVPVTNSLSTKKSEYSKMDDQNKLLVVGWIQLDWLDWVLKLPSTQ